MKATLRVPTNEQYAYIECQVEGTEEEIVAQYHKMTSAVRGGFGLSDDQFNVCLDEYRTTGTLKEGTEFYAEMSLEQQAIFQAIKKSDKRLAYKKK